MSSYRSKLRFIFFVSLIPFVVILGAVPWLFDQPISHLQGHEELLSELKRARWITIATSLLGVVGLFLFYLSPSIRHPLDKLKKGFETLLKGDYSFRLPVESQDERASLETAFNELAQSVQEFWKEAERIQQQFANTLSLLSQSAERIEDHAKAQMTSVRHIYANMRGIDNSVQTFVDEMHQATRTVMTTQTLATTGEMGLHEMEEIMKKMLTTSSNIVSTLSILQEEVGSVNKVILTIVKIADQSNLLSLNTAIRANKSGVQGKGFTVIADRIREMADQIALATLDIEKAVQKIVKAVSDASVGVNAFSEQIGIQDVETAEISREIKQLIDHTHRQLQQFENIKEAILRQVQQISLVTQFIGQVKKEAEVSHVLAGRLRKEIHTLQSGLHLGGTN